MVTLTAVPMAQPMRTGSAICPSCVMRVMLSVALLRPGQSTLPQPRRCSSSAWSRSRTSPQGLGYFHLVIAAVPHVSQGDSIIATVSSASPATRTPATSSRPLADTRTPAEDGARSLATPPTSRREPSAGGPPADPDGTAGDRVSAVIRWADPDSGLEQRLDHSVFLVLEHLVRLGAFFQRHVVGGEGIDAEGVLVGEQRQEVIHPVLHIGLPHA